MLSFDRVLTPNITLGARLGYAFNGGPRRGQGQGREIPAVPRGGAHSVLDRGKDVFAKKGLRPYIARAAAWPRSTPSSR